MGFLSFCKRSIARASKKRKASKNELLSFSEGSLKSNERCLEPKMVEDLCLRRLHPKGQSLSCWECWDCLGILP